MSASHDDFFIGWADRLPPASRASIRAVALGFLALMLLLALGLARAMDDNGAGGVDPGGERTLRGTVTRMPYAVLHLPPDATHPAGHAVTLAVVGKSAPEIPADWEGKSIEATGWMVKRGAMDLLQMTDDPKRIDLAPSLPKVERLGRWRLTGEICDGQCYAGLMRPGTGIAHRACANFCLIGGVAPVFVTTAPVEGGSFLLMAGPDGGIVPPAMYDYVGLRVRLDGDIERRGDLLVFRPDWATVSVP